MWVKPREHVVMKVPKFGTLRMATSLAIVHRMMKVTCKRDQTTQRGTKGSGALAMRAPSPRLPDVPAPPPPPPCPAVP